MFRKLVSNLPFSPALVGQLGFYARRLRTEQASRRLGLIFTVLAITVQAFALIKPPEQTIAATPITACVFDSTLTKDDTNCQTCPYNSTIWVKDTNCVPSIKLSVNAINLSQGGKPANTTTAAPGDRIQYNLHTRNSGTETTNAAVQTNIADLLEYARPIDLGGGVFDANTDSMSWGTVDLSPNQTDTRSFVVEINETVAATPQAVDNPRSYDCTLTSIYGNTLNIRLGCPMGKTVESTVHQLPGASLPLVGLFCVLLLATTVFFYARSRQLSRELRLVRRQFNVGPS